MHYKRDKLWLRSPLGLKSLFISPVSLAVIMVSMRRSLPSQLP